MSTFRIRPTIKGNIACPLDSEAAVASALSMVEFQSLTLLIRALPEGMAGDGYWDQQTPQAIIQKALLATQKHDLMNPIQSQSAPHNITRSGRVSIPTKSYPEDEEPSGQVHQPKMDFALLVKDPNDDDDTTCVALMKTHSSSGMKRSYESMEVGQDVLVAPGFNKRQCVAVQEVSNKDEAMMMMMMMMRP